MLDSCEGLLTIDASTKVLSTCSFSNNKAPGSDGLTIESYHFFWDIFETCAVDSCNYAFQKGCLSISQKLVVVFLIPKNTQKLRTTKELETHIVIKHGLQNRYQSYSRAFGKSITLNQLESASD